MLFCEGILRGFLLCNQPLPQDSCLGVGEQRSDTEDLMFWRDGGCGRECIDDGALEPLETSRY